MELRNSYPYSKLTEYFVRENLITKETKYEVKKIKARQLITCSRIDLMAKWIYIDAKEKNMDMSFARELYVRHIEAFSGGKFFEPGTDEKNSEEVFLTVFDNLIDNIKKNGFDEEISLVPVGDDNIILDGAHRVAIAAYYDYEISVIYFPGMSRDMNYQYFRNSLLHDSYLDLMVLQYCEMKNDIYCACIWPRAYDIGKRRKAVGLLEEMGNIVYMCERNLDYRGLTNLMIQAYAGQSWIGDYKNKHSGIKGKVDECYKKNTSTYVVFFEAECLEDVVRVKEQIRDVFGLANHSIHISDNAEETRALARLLLNINSVHHMKYGNPDEYPGTAQKLEVFKKAVVKSGRRKEDFVIDSGTALAVWGLRQSKDLDYMLMDADKDVFELEDVEEHSSEMQYHICAKQDLIYNPLNYFVYDGMKFVSLENLRSMKEKRGSDKDMNDVKLINRAMRKYRRDLSKEQKSCEANAKARYVRVNGTKIQKIRGYIYRCYRFITSNDYRNGVKREIWLKKKRGGVLNREFSLISSNCNGGCILSELEIRFNSPFVNLFITAPDYIKMLKNLKYYMGCELEFVEGGTDLYPNVSYPVGKLDDIYIYFMHYENQEVAKRKWDERCERINYEKLFIIMTDRSYCSYEDILEFDRLPYKNKVIFTHVPYPEVQSAFYIKGFEKEDKVGILSDFEKNSWKRYYDQFDFVKWINQ